MKTCTLLLGSVAALSVLCASAAHADATLPPTDALIGNWCETKADSGMFKRGTCKENQEWERLTIVREGYEFWEWGCTFLDVKRTPNGFEAYSECGFGESYSFEKVVFELADKQLKYRRISSGYDAEWPERQYDCAMVRDEVPAGYLNLREGPGMSFRVRAKLIPQREYFKPGAETKGGE